MAQADISDCLAPKSLIIPILSATSEADKPRTTDSGHIWLSGGKLYFSTGSAIEQVTSA